MLGVRYERTCASPPVLLLPAIVAAAEPHAQARCLEFFALKMLFAMHMLARRQGCSPQSLMAEAFNGVLRKHGESSIGE